ncbi:MAG: hypothetical protein AAB837_00860 [Patescibacteria group bacterium]
MEKTRVEKVKVSIFLDRDLHTKLKLHSVKKVTSIQKVVEEFVRQTLLASNDSSEHPEIDDYLGDLRKVMLSLESLSDKRFLKIFMRSLNAQYKAIMEEQTLPNV